MATIDTDLPSLLARRLAGPLPGRQAQAEFEPALAGGRHFDPPPPTARQGAVIALLYPHDGEWRLPLTLRPAHLPEHAGQICLPGGMVEPGESSWEAGLRELNEELGVPANSVRALGRLTPLYVFVSNFNVTPWVAVVDRRPEWIPSPAEVADVIEAPLAHLVDPANRGTHIRQRQGVEFAAPHIAIGSHWIWGATSMILGEMACICGPLIIPPGPEIIDTH